MFFLRLVLNLEAVLNLFLVTCGKAIVFKKISGAADCISAVQQQIRL